MQTLTPAPHIALSLRFARRSLRLTRASCQPRRAKALAAVTSGRLFHYSTNDVFTVDLARIDFPISF
ncbi:hypothetical protein EFP84_19400 [Leptospira kmetyi]|uniref:Uncharacterized protein n=1 Tax=Leptospira kmetyi TaxID=408139 RepID=A0AAD0USS2_9LEPT|nr:hypothetical protein EFP84_19400 [Leptospira kmetyi]